MTSKKTGATKKSGAKKGSAKKGAAKKSARKPSAAKITKAALALHAHVFMAADAITFIAVCQVDGAVGPTRTNRAAATTDAINHKASTGHIVKVIQTQSVG